MIEKAKSNDPNGEYFCKNLLSWVPKNKADIVHSMEVFYYFKSPLILTRHIVKNWMNPGGQLVVGMDHYVGNKESYSWSKDLNVHMTLLSDNDWLEVTCQDCRAKLVFGRTKKGGLIFPKIRWDQLSEKQKEQRANENVYAEKHRGYLPNKGWFIYKPKK